MSDCDEVATETANAGSPHQLQEPALAPKKLLAPGATPPQKKVALPPDRLAISRQSPLPAASQPATSEGHASLALTSSTTARGGLCPTMIMASSVRAAQPRTGTASLVTPSGPQSSAPVMAARNYLTT